MIHRVYLVTDEELDNPAFLADVKRFVRHWGKSPVWLFNRLVDGWMISDIDIVDREGNPVELTFEALEFPDDDDEPQKDMKSWIKEWCEPPRPGVLPRVKGAARERVRLIGTLLRVSFPKESTVWGVPVRQPPSITDQMLS